MITSFDTEISLSNNSDDHSSQSDDNESLRKRKMISKASRTRNLQLSSKWTEIDLIKYWLFYLDYQIKKPFQKTSWENWKGDSIYKDMEKFIGKTAKQCKSKDQNMKTKLYGDSNDGDIVQLAIKKLKEAIEKIESIPEELTQEILNSIIKYEELKTQKSEHMILLEKRM